MRRISRVLKELLLGIFICGIFFQLVLFWMFEDKISYAAGLWIGVFFSMIKAVHIERSIQNAWNRNEKNAVSYIKIMYGLRSVASLLLIVLVWYWNLGNIAALFLGMITLKGGAFLQMPIHNLFQKNRKKETAEKNRDIVFRR